MDPFDDDDKYRKKRRSPFDFMGEDEFEKIFEEVEKMFESSNFKDMIEEMLRGGASNKRFVHGFSLNIGPDGKPRMQEFGNKPLKSAEGEPVISEEREPLTDIIEGDEDVAVTVEIPGVERKDIDLNVTNDNTLEIKVDTADRKYHKRLDLPCDVLPKTTKATYKNGVLDVVIKRKEKKKAGEGHKVNIE
jgi:HSP20 family protein